VWPNWHEYDQGGASFPKEKFAAKILHHSQNVDAFVAVGGLAVLLQAIESFSKGSVGKFLDRLSFLTLRRTFCLSANLFGSVRFERFGFIVRLQLYGSSAKETH
jgi:hypothetical protein